MAAETDNKDFTILVDNYNWFGSLLQLEVLEFLKKHSYNGYMMHGILSVPFEVKLRHLDVMFQEANMVALTRDRDCSEKSITGISFGYITEKPDDRSSHLDIFYYGRDWCTDTLVRHVARQISYSNSSSLSAHPSLMVTVQVGNQFDADYVKYSLYNLLGRNFEIPPPYDSPRMVLARYKIKD